MIRGLATDIIIRRVSPTTALWKREVHSRRFIKRVLQAPASRREREFYFDTIYTTKKARHKASQRGSTPKRDAEVGNKQESALPSHQQSIPLPLRYAATYVPPFVLPNGWAPPPPPEERPKNLPFNVARTHVGNSLPIYTDVKNGGARVYTIVRRVSGNLDEFVRELRCVCAEDRIIRRGGGFQVPGNHVKAVKNWLYGLGF